MRNILSTIVILLGFCVNAEVHYFAGRVAQVPQGEVKAVEARAAAGNQRGGSWKLCWPGVELMLRFSADGFVDGVDRPSALLTFNGEKIVCSRGVATSGNPNTIAVEWRGDSVAAILVGERELYEVATAVIPKPVDSVAVSGHSAPFDLIDLIIETDSDSFGRLKSGLDGQIIASGRVWSYLDREADPKVAVVGGQYRLAQVGSDLIYLEGARTNAGAWKPGMVKARLIPTAFENYFKVVWYDSAGRELRGENYAEVNSDLGTMKISFPELGASMRFYDCR